MIEDLKRQHDLLLQEMQACQYKLTSVEEKGLMIISKGYLGYLLTEGLWLKLRIWICIEEDNFIKCKLILSENYVYKENALKALHSILQNVKSQSTLK